MLALSKILDNMEIGHNVMHGQYDWMGDPAISSRGFEWDNACPGDQWRHSHNYMHHTHTNIVGMDRDIGYGVLRMSEDQRWSPYYLGNPVYAFLLMVLFQYGVALHELETERIRSGEITLADKRDILKASGARPSVKCSPDRRDQPFEHQCLSVMYCGVLTSGVRMMDRVLERVAFAGAVGRGVAQRALDEAGVLYQRALPAGDQPGVGVDDERGVAESAAVERDVREVGHDQKVRRRNPPVSAHQIRGPGRGRVALGGARRVASTGGAAPAVARA